MVWLYVVIGEFWGTWGLGKRASEQFGDLGAIGFSLRRSSCI